MFEFWVNCCLLAVIVYFIFSLINKIVFKRKRLALISIILAVVVCFSCFIVYESSLFLVLGIILTFTRTIQFLIYKYENTSEKKQYNDNRLSKPAKKLEKLYELKLKLDVAQRHVQEIIDKLGDVLDKCNQNQICYEHVEFLFKVHLNNYMSMCECYLELDEKEMSAAKNRISALTEKYKEVIEQALKEAHYKAENSVSSEAQEFDSRAEILSAGLDAFNSITPEHQGLEEFPEQNN